MARFERIDSNCGHQALRTDGETGLVSGCNLREKKRSDRYFWMDVGGLEEPALDSEECGTKEPKCSLSKMGQQLVQVIVELSLNLMQQSPRASCLPIQSVCHTTDGEREVEEGKSPTGSALDTLRSTSDSPSCSDRGPVSAAAHLHLLGESLSLIGHHLQETDKMVSMSSSLSLLLDSLLCALAPLICLTAQIPELRSCTEHTLASTLENISYVMPGL
ncbi:HMG domain-containing protein 4-like isoform X5 [Seriola dumerili]|uniref:HMG domain-containing protein 4-like isoform X5 n=1 Tax=Seriola dumerili TaxID=41447 RepID=UPI000BBEE539|nr:HMG domain-containing protein 4-like isoform X5 [Seriola dumerili]